ncbi:MAG: response regulator, partial [Desulfobacterales bacterium]|nr:response regulator [Desulfobacterales bacterium]
MDDNQSLTPKASLLIVDDIHKNLQVLGKMLRKEEAYEIAFSDNGAQALKIAAKLHPDLILLDVMMPEMDGFEVCRQLKADPETREISIMFLTARAEVDSVVKGFDVGAVDYITKPFNKRELIARVNNHLERIRSKRDLQLKNEELSKAMEEIKTLRGILPICAECKNVRDDKG